MKIYFTVAPLKPGWRHLAQLTLFNISGSESGGEWQAEDKKTKWIWSKVNVTEASQWAGALLWRRGQLTSSHRVCFRPVEWFCWSEQDFFFCLVEYEQHASTAWQRKAVPSFPRSNGSHLLQHFFSRFEQQSFLCSSQTFIYFFFLGMINLGLASPTTSRLPASFSHHAE